MKEIRIELRGMEEETARRAAMHALYEIAQGFDGVDFQVVSKSVEENAEVQTFAFMADAKKDKKRARLPHIIHKRKVRWS